MPIGHAASEPQSGGTRHRGLPPEEAAADVRLGVSWWVLVHSWSLLAIQIVRDVAGQRVRLP